MNRCLNKQQTWGGIPFQLMILNITVGTVSFLALGSYQILIVCVMIYVFAKIIHWYEPLIFYFLGSYLGMSDLIPDDKKGRYGKSFSKSLIWKNIVGSYNSGAIIKNNNGSFQITFKILGIDFLSMSWPAIQRSLDVMNDAFKIFAKHKITVMGDYRRSKYSLISNPSVKDRTMSLYTIGLIEAERKNLNKNFEQYKNEIFLTIIFKPQSGDQKITNFSTIFIKSNPEQPSISKEQEIEIFISILDKFINIVSKNFKLTPLNEQQTVKYLHSCVSTKLFNLNSRIFDNLPNLSKILPDQFLYKGLFPLLGDLYIRAIGIINFPINFDSEMRNIIGRLPVQFRWITRIDLLTQAQAQKLVKNKKIVWKNSAIKLRAVFASMFTSIGDLDNDTEKLELDMVEECQDIMNDLIENKYVLANVSSTIITMNKDESTAIKESEQIKKVMENYGIDTCIEGLNTMQAFLSSIPGSIHKNPRQFTLTSKNLINYFLPLSSPWEGSPDQNCLFTAKGRD